MKIAIFNGFAFHYEMFGYLIDYFKGAEIHLYTEQKNNMEWFRYYLSIFPKIFKLFHYTTFSPSSYDIVVLLTDDDPDWRHNNWVSPRTLCIDHHSTNRRPSIPEIRHIGTRFFNDRPTLSWCLPVFRMIDVSTKKNIVKRDTVMCIGNNINEKLFTWGKDMKYILVDRNLDIKKYENLKIHFFKN